MPCARDEIDEEREAARRLWQQAFDRLADYLRELEEAPDEQEPHGG